MISILQFLIAVITVMEVILACRKTKKNVHIDARNTRKQQDEAVKRSASSPPVYRRNINNEKSGVRSTSIQRMLEKKLDATQHEEDSYEGSMRMETQRSLREDSGSNKQLKSKIVTRSGVQVNQTQTHESRLPQEQKTSSNSSKTRYLETGEDQNVSKKQVSKQRPIMSAAQKSSKSQKSQTRTESTKATSSRKKKRDVEKLNAKKDGSDKSVVSGKSSKTKSSKKEGKAKTSPKAKRSGSRQEETTKKSKKMPGKSETATKSGKSKKSKKAPRKASNKSEKCGKSGKSFFSKKASGASGKQKSDRTQVVAQ